MAIDVSVQYNCGYLPNIILLTQVYSYWGTHSKYFEEIVFLAYETTILYT